MSELSSVDLWDEGDYQSPFPSQEKSHAWEQIGRISLASGLIFSAPAFFSTYQIKRRTVTRPGKEGEALSLSISIPETENRPETDPPGPIAYNQLHCTPDDQKIIGQIINTVADGGIDLLWKIPFLDELGEKILPVHPYKFLSTILLDRHLRNQLKRIFRDPLPFKKSGFLGGVKKGMEREAANLETHIKEFASEMGTRPKTIRPFIQQGEWNGLVIHLLAANPRLRN